LLFVHKPQDSGKYAEQTKTNSAETGPIYRQHGGNSYYDATEPEDQVAKRPRILNECNHVFAGEALGKPDKMDDAYSEHDTAYS
jgi:hypothetical protein